VSDDSRSRAAAVSALRRDLATRGFSSKPTGRILLELASHVLLAVGGLVVFFVSDHLLVRIAGLLISTLGSTGVGTNTHTSSHYATSETRWVNEALTCFGYPVFLGLSATFWWNKHVVVHHPAPNVIEVDGDADFMPWLALTDRDLDQVRGWRRIYHRHLQWWLFPIILGANGFNMGRAGWTHVLQHLFDRERRKVVHWVDCGCLLLHLALYLGLPLLIVSFPVALGAYAVRTILMGYALFAVLGPGHLPAEAARLSAEHKDADYLLRQTATTINFRTRLVGRFICSGLEYQIEHHLFPHVSHVHYPAMSLVVKEFCGVQGLPYRCYPWPVALWKCWQVVSRPRTIETDLESLRVSSLIPHP
jgi:linoleoyl-CoA desaturase